MSDALLLVTVADAMKSMGINAALETEVAGTISDAIIRSVYRVEVELGTRLLPAKAVELYNCNLDPYCGVVPNGMISLKLSNFYLSDTFPAVVEVSDYWNGEFTAIDPSSYILNKLSGVVMLPSIDYSDKFVRVTYECGFVDSFSLPEELKQAVLAYLPEVFKAGQGQSSDTEGVPPKAASEFAGLILTKQKRRLGVCISPMSTLYEAV